MMRTPLVVGNWKMNGRLADARALANAVVEQTADFAGVERAVCPPYVHLPAVSETLAGTDVGLGAQNCADTPPGAHTGEVAAEMLSDLGVGYVILGHSERRQFDHEEEAGIAARYAQALEQGLRPILCVGESLEVREAGATDRLVADQITGVLDRLGAQGLGDGVIAYEPIWAIGTGLTATADQAQAVHASIRALLARHIGQAADKVRIIYGGSMKAANAQALLAQPDVDGGLIGGASLKAEEFAAICAAAARG